MPRLCPPLPFHRPSEPSEFLLGRLVLPTGQLIACDPVTGLGEARPFARTVAPGTYAVRLGALGGDAAYVALMVGAPGAAVARWEAALRTGQAAPEALERAPGFSVDACTAGYLDVAGVPQLERADRLDVLSRLLMAGYAERPHAVVDLGGGGNLVAFGTGTDGRFASYWGLDRHGVPVVLVTDLNVLRPAVRPSKPGAKIIPFPRRR